MKTSLKRASAAMGVAGLLLAAGLLGAGVSSDPAASAASQAAPSVDTPWSTPLDVSNSGSYDQSPWIAANVLNGSVTVAWEEGDRQGSSFSSIQQNSNTAFASAFRGNQELENGPGSAKDRNVRAAGDSLGRRYIVWWAPEGSETCGRYARVDADGIVRPPLAQEIPNSCASNDQARKNVAAAVGPDNSLHVLMGRNSVPGNIYYWQMSATGSWVVQAEAVPNHTRPKNLSIAVSALGTVMAAWVDTSGSRNDVFYSIRQGTNSWTPLDAAHPPISINVFAGDSRAGTHRPAIAADHIGGLRIAWDQIRTDPYEDPGFNDILYDEWTPTGGWDPNPIRITRNSGESYYPALSVDYAGKSHLVWSDNTRGPSELYYASGNSAIGMTLYIHDPRYPGVVYCTSGGCDPVSYFQKEPSITTNPPVAGVGAYAHVAFGSNYNGDSQKENLYSYVPASGGIILTPTPTPTCVPGSYTDVFPADYYYVPAQSLGRAGVMNGYSDCTFRPGNSITRAQTAKIVILGAGRAIDTHGGPHFRDVPTNDPFYSFIETAYNDGIISGYSCGTGCLEFRPGNNVTRAQFSKMVVLAFRFGIDTTGGPHFTDVPTTDAFYGFIETAFNRGLISGYADRTFRPGNDLTRGQGAKIVYQARQLVTVSPTSTPIVVTFTPTQTPVVVTATPTITAIVVTSTPTETPNIITATPTSTFVPTLTVTRTPTVLN